MPIYETGHARNIEHFATMIAFVNGWGGVYKPTNTAIEPAALQTKLDASNSTMDTVTTMLAQSKTAINARENAFAGLRKLVTRAVNYYASTGADANAIADAQGLKRKIDGKRAETLVDDPNTPEDESQGGISVSQQSFTQLVEHFDGLIALLKGDALYAPNETELQIVQLETLSANLKAANTGVMNNFIPVSNARGARNAEMYADGTGLVDIALTVKKYAKAAFGTDSANYAQISGLEFHRPR